MTEPLYKVGDEFIHKTTSMKARITGIIAKTNSYIPSLGAHYFIEIESVGYPPFISSRYEEELTTFYHKVRSEPEITLVVDHSKHEVVVNEILGKSFLYCRDCKEEA